ncbi:unnamed protein product, partial [Oncorhynchus mykiss]
FPSPHVDVFYSLFSSCFLFCSIRLSWPCRLPLDLGWVWGYGAPAEGLDVMVVHRGEVWRLLGERVHRGNGWGQGSGERDGWSRAWGKGWDRAWVEACRESLEAGCSPCLSCSFSSSPRCSPSVLTAATVCGRATWCCVRMLGSVSSPRAFLWTPSHYTWRETTSDRSLREPSGKEDNTDPPEGAVSLPQPHQHPLLRGPATPELRAPSPGPLPQPASRDEFGSTRAKTRLYNNPWHCDCTLQELMETLNLEPETVNGIMCESSVRSSGEGKHSGQPLVKLLNSGVNFCRLQRKTTDVAMLVTMFVWFFMVIVYVVYYVRQNQAETRRHLEYLKSLPSPRKTLTETDTISTGL